MALTVNGVPYPLGTDRVRDGAGMIQQLAEYVDAALNTRCRIYQTAPVSCANGSTTKIPMQAEESDPTGMHSTSADLTQIRIAKPGRYLVIGQLGWLNNNAGWRVVGIAVNGVNKALTRLPAAQGSQHLQQASGVITCAGGDYVELIGIQNCGAALNTYEGQANTWLEVSWAGAV